MNATEACKLKVNKKATEDKMALLSQELQQNTYEDKVRSHTKKTQDFSPKSLDLVRRKDIRGKEHRR